MTKKTNSNDNHPSDVSKRGEGGDEMFQSTDSCRSAVPLKHARYWDIPGPFVLDSGEELHEVRVCYETFGTLNADRSNAVYICHALSGNSHVTRHNEKDDLGWWEGMVGPGKPIDTDKYFVICSNILGGCSGTTGPSNVNPDTGRRYGSSFPKVTVQDMTALQYRLVTEKLGIKRLLALVGGSLGGFNALDWAVRFPDSTASTLAIATGPCMSSQAMAFDVVGRNAIQSDPDFADGDYYDRETGPETGLKLARMLAHITYLSRDSMKRKFDPERNCGRDVLSLFETKFAVSSYLAYQGEKFADRFDANCYVTITNAIDYFELGVDPEANRKTKEFDRVQLLGQAIAESTCRWLIVSFTSDWLFDESQSRELVGAALRSDKRVTYCNIACDGGHDSFLLEEPIKGNYGALVGAFLRSVAESAGIAGAHSAQPIQTPRIETAESNNRIDYDRIVELIGEDESVLDLGCGTGDLLLRLRRSGAQRRLVGVDLSEEYVLSCVERGLDVIHADLDKGLRGFSDQQFDYVVLSKTLQTVRNVVYLLDEMLRVGRRAIVSFPNFGYHRYRTQLEMFGTAPQTDLRDETHWYNTADVRFLTIADFRELCDTKGYKIHQFIALDTWKGRVVNEEEANVEADMAVVVLSR
ncbi:MAG: homoserine O-acetyltransferase [Thermoguttaceae bacterium]|nr:homoserine O-acetyltransferase [Thermoguttaceae bacterium]MBQ6620073.1 homoserine O-acetyltransferase [Thermoguttaceae bacterium]